MSNFQNLMCFLINCVTSIVQHDFLMHSNDKDALEEPQHSMIPSTNSEAETSRAGV